MSFREKSAWVTLISILLVTYMFFLHVSWTLNPEPSMWRVHALLACLLTFIVIEVIAHIVLYLKFPRDARTPRDEREQLIDLKATRIAAYVYVVASFLAVGTMHLGANRIGIACNVLLAFVLAEIINYATRIYYYRRS